MPDVRKTTRYILVAGAGLAVLFVLAQVAQLAELAGAIHPWFGVAVAAGLLLAIGWLVAVPALAYLRLRPALVPPDHAESPTREAFVDAYLEECRRNPRLEDGSLDSEEDLEAALEVLTADAERIANRYASQVFVGTAVSQWGSLASRRGWSGRSRTCISVDRPSGRSGTSTRTWGRRLCWLRGWTRSTCRSSCGRCSRERSVSRSRRCPASRRSRRRCPTRCSRVR